MGPLIARGSCGSLQEGSFKGKMIVVAATMDESAFPWQIDWYRGRVKKHFGDDTDDHYRVYFFDNAFHDDSAKTVDELHLISYLGGLHQALLDLSAWVEKGIEPPKSSVYDIKESQIVLAETAKVRGGIQPVVKLYANGEKGVKAQCGETVQFRTEIEIPEGAGKITKVEWSFEGEQDYPVKTDFNSTENGGFAECSHSYKKTGTHFAAVRVSIQRDGTDNIFTQVKNLDRARIEVI